MSIAQAAGSIYIGNHGQGNGILVLAGNDDTAIVVGPGIAGAVPDVFLTRLRRDVLVPIVERDGMSAGPVATLESLAAASLGEETFATSYDYARPREDLLASPERAQELRWIALLSGMGIVYAGVLLWRRFKVKT